MNHPFTTILQFLHDADCEVQGREALAPDAPTLKRLERFARGDATEQERSELCQLIKQNPQWVSFLAESVKRLREQHA